MDNGDSGIGQRIADVQETLRKLNDSPHILDLHFPTPCTIKPVQHTAKTTPMKLRSSSHLHERTPQNPYQITPQKQRLARRVKALEKELKASEAAKVEVRQLKKACAELEKEVKGLKAENCSLKAVVNRQTKALHKQSNLLLLSERAKKEQPENKNELQAEIEFLRQENLELLRELKVQPVVEHQSKRSERFIAKVVRLAKKHSVETSLKPIWQWIKTLADNNLLATIAASLNVADPKELPAALQRVLLDQEEMLMVLNDLKVSLGLSEDTTLRELHQEISDKF